MPSFRTTRRVPHSAARMFDLVADVEQYPKFLPLCQSLHVRRRSVLPAGEDMLVADMRIGYKAIRESFTSRVTLDRPHLTIVVEYIDGPFRSLENRWVFRDDPVAGEGGLLPRTLAAPDEVGALALSVAARSTIEFFITYEFKSRMFGVLMGSMFDAAFRKFAEAFERRAAEVYG